jgi:ribosomal-protein-serine acetyltransferase
MNDQGFLFLRKMESIVVSNEILLQRIELQDAALIFKAIDSNREWLSKWLPFVPLTKELKDTKVFVKSVIEKRDFNGNEVFTIWYKGDFAGIIGFHNTDKFSEKTEIGYWLIQEMTSKGIITTCVKALLKQAFNFINLNRITLKCAIDNKASEKVALRTGFLFEGIERHGEKLNDKFIDLKIYSILKQDWKEA